MTKFLLFSIAKPVEELEVVKEFPGTVRADLGDVLVFNEIGYKVVSVIKWMDGLPNPQVDYVMLPIQLRCAKMKNEERVINGSRTS